MLAIVRIGLSRPHTFVVAAVLIAAAMALFFAVAAAFPAAG